MNAIKTEPIIQLHSQLLMHNNLSNTVILHKKSCINFHTLHNIQEITYKFFDKSEFCGIIVFEVSANFEGGRTTAENCYSAPSLPHPNTERNDP